MDKIYEKRVIFMDKLRDLCITNRWFTRATNEVYDRFLHMVKTEDCTHLVDVDNDLLQRMALMVQEYSDLSDETSIPYIMFTLAQIRVSFFGYTEPGSEAQA